MAKTAPAAPSFRDHMLSGLKEAFKKEDGVRIRTADDVSYLTEIKRYQPTGIDQLDFNLSLGHGFPCGRMVEVFGKESSGKTALMEFLVGKYTQAGSLAHFLDYEESLDDTHLACYGTDRKELFTPEFETLEQGIDYMANALQLIQDYSAERSAKSTPLPPSAFFVDSVAAACPKAEMEEDSVEDSHMALVARAMARGCRKLTRPLSNTDATLFFVNQVRDIFNAKPGQKQTKTPGGWALKFAYSIRLELSMVEMLKGKNDRYIGQRVRIVTEKNKHAPRRMTAEVMLSYTRGIDADWSNFEWYKDNGYIVPGGKTGYRWDGLEEKFMRREFGAWRQAHAAKVDTAKAELYASALKDMDTSGLPGKEAEKPKEDDDADAAQE